MPVATQILLPPNENRKLLKRNGRLLSKKDIAHARNLIKKKSKENEGYRLAKRESGLKYTVIRFPNNPHLYAISSSKTARSGKFIAGKSGEFKYMQNLDTGKWFGLKIIRMIPGVKKGSRSFDNPMSSRLIEREEKILSSLEMDVNKEGISYFREAGIKGKPSDEQYLLGIKLVPGIQLANFLENRQLSPYEFCNLAVRSLEALESLHEKGWVHNDFHLGNLLYDENQDKIGIVDFGQSSDINTLESDQQDLRRGRDVAMFLLAFVSTAGLNSMPKEIQKPLKYFTQLLTTSGKVHPFYVLDARIDAGDKVPELKEMLEFFEKMKSNFSEVIEDVEVINADNFQTRMSTWKTQLHKEIKAMLRRGTHTVQFISTKVKLNIKKLISLRERFEAFGNSVKHWVVHNGPGEKLTQQKLVKEARELLKKHALLIQVKERNSIEYNSLNESQKNLVKQIIYRESLPAKLSDEDLKIVKDFISKIETPSEGVKKRLIERLEIIARDKKNKEPQTKEPSLFLKQGVKSKLKKASFFNANQRQKRRVMSELSKKISQTKRY